METEPVLDQWVQRLFDTAIISNGEPTHHSGECPTSVADDLALTAQIADRCIRDMNRDISTLRTHVGHPKRVLDRLRDFIADDTHDPRVGDFIARQAATHAWITTGLTTRTLTASEARTLTTGIDAERRDVYNHPDLARGICCIVPGLIARLAAEFATPEAWEQFRRQTRDRGNAIRSSPEAT